MFLFEVVVRSMFVDEEFSVFIYLVFGVGSYGLDDRLGVGGVMLEVVVEIVLGVFVLVGSVGRVIELLISIVSGNGGGGGSGSVGRVSGNDESGGLGSWDIDRG